MAASLKEGFALQAQVRHLRAEWLGSLGCKRMQQQHKQGRMSSNKAWGPASMAGKQGAVAESAITAARHTGQPTHQPTRTHTDMSQTPTRALQPQKHPQSAFSPVTARDLAVADADDAPLALRQLLKGPASSVAWAHPCTGQHDYLSFCGPWPGGGTTDASIKPASTSSKVSTSLGKPLRLTMWTCQNESSPHST